MSDIELRVGGDSFVGWKEVSITRSIEQLASTFSITSSELWTENDEEIPIREGSACEVWTRLHRMIQGYIDSSDGFYDANDHRLSVSGRSNLGDLVDCSAIVSGGVIKNQTLYGLISLVCQPFGISVVSEATSADKFRRFSVQDGETVIEVIERAAKARGLMVISNDDGKLVITSPGYSRAGTALRYGENILSGGRRASWSDRFSQYTVKSQNSGSEDWFGRSAAHIKATVTDETVSRYRPFVMIAEEQLDQNGCTARATWERNVRSGKSQRLVYTVRGWDDRGDIWTPNQLVSVFDPRYGIDDDLLLVTVVSSKSERGEMSELTLTHPSAFSGTATPPKARSGKDFW